MGLGEELELEAGMDDEPAFEVELEPENALKDELGAPPKPPGPELEDEEGSRDDEEEDDELELGGEDEPGLELELNEEPSGLVNPIGPDDENEDGSITDELELELERELELGVRLVTDRPFFLELHLNKLILTAL